MMEELVEWLKQLAVFMILCETILSFAPTKTYKKYIKPFVGMILLFRITVFLFGAAQVDWNRRVENVFEHYEQSISSYLDKEEIVNENTNDKILNEDIINIQDVSIDKIRIGEIE